MIKWPKAGRYGDYWRTAGAQHWNRQSLGTMWRATQMLLLTASYIIGTRVVLPWVDVDTLGSAVDASPLLAAVNGVLTGGALGRAGFYPLGTIPLVFLEGRAVTIRGSRIKINNHVHVPSLRWVVLVLAIYTGWLAWLGVVPTTWWFLLALLAYFFIGTLVLFEVETLCIQRGGPDFVSVSATLLVAGYLRQLALSHTPGQVALGVLVMLFVALSVVLLRLTIRIPIRSIADFQPRLSEFTYQPGQSPGRFVFLGFLLIVSLTVQGLAALVIPAHAANIEAIVSLAGVIIGTTVAIALFQWQPNIVGLLSGFSATAVAQLMRANYFVIRGLRPGNATAGFLRERVIATSARGYLLVVAWILALAALESLGPLIGLDPGAVLFGPVGFALLLTFSLEGIFLLLLSLQDYWIRTFRADPYTALSQARDWGELSLPPADIQSVLDDIVSPLGDQMSDEEREALFRADARAVAVLAGRLTRRIAIPAVAKVVITGATTLVIMGLFVWTVTSVFGVELSSSDRVSVAGVGLAMWVSLLFAPQLDLPHVSGMLKRVGTRGPRRQVQATTSAPPTHTDQAPPALARPSAASAASAGSAASAAGPAAPQDALDRIDLSVGGQISGSSGSVRIEFPPSHGLGSLRIHIVPRAPDELPAPPDGFVLGSVCEQITCSDEYGATLEVFPRLAILSVVPGADDVKGPLIYTLDAQTSGWRHADTIANPDGSLSSMLARPATICLMVPRNAAEKPD